MGNSNFSDPSKRLLPLSAIAPSASGQIRDISTNYWFGPLQPVTTSAPPDYRPRQWAYQPGANLIWQPKGDDPLDFWTLRNLANSWDLLAAVITTQVQKLARVKWEIRGKAKAGETGKDARQRNLGDPVVRQLRDFWDYPDGIHHFEDWISMWIRDCIEIDAVALYAARDKSGKVHSIHPIDGATVNRLITDQGFTPPAPSPAYQQVVYGTPVWDFTINDLLYAMMNERTYGRYGWSCVEQIINYVSFGIRRLQWQISEYTSGSVPEALVFLPSDLPVDRVAEVQSWFDSILAGDLDQRRRIRFLPGYGTGDDAKPNIIFPKEPLLKDELDTWLAQIVCFTIGVSAQPFLKMINRASAEQAQEISEEEGTAPYIAYIARVLNKLLQVYMGFADYEFVQQEHRELDVLKQAQADNIIVGKINTINEIRERRGEDPRPEPEANQLGEFTAQGFVPLGALSSTPDNQSQTPKDGATAVKNTDQKKTSKLLRMSY
jgi:hypothetical protein